MRISVFCIGFLSALIFTPASQAAPDCDCVKVGARGIALKQWKSFEGLATGYALEYFTFGAPHLYPNDPNGYYTQYMTYQSETEAQGACQELLASLTKKRRCR